MYLVHSELPEISMEFASKIPAHRNYVNTLFANGVLHTYAVNDEKTQWWVCIKAMSEESVWEILGEMPIIEFLKPKVYPLFLYNGAEELMPKISLN